MPGTVFKLSHLPTESLLIPIARPAAKFSATAVFGQLWKESEASLQVKLGERFYQEMLSLTQERDPVVFFGGLLELGNRLQDGGKIQAAAEVFHFIAFEGASTTPYLSLPEGRAERPGGGPVLLSITQKAGQRFEILQGRGPVGARLALGVERVSEAVLEPETLMPMVAGAAVFQTARAMMLGKFAAMTELTWYNRGWTARLGASGVGLMLEAPVFGLGSRYLSQLQDKPVSPSAFGDVARAGLTLLAFRGAAFTAGQLALRWNGVSELRAGFGTVGSGRGEWVLSQAALLGGLYLAQRAQVWADLLPASELASSPADLFVSLFDLQVAGHLADRAMGASFFKFRQEAGMRSEIFFSAESPPWKQPVVAAAQGIADYWKRRPVGFLLMAFPPGGKGDAPNPQIVARIHASIRTAIVDKWRQEKFGVGKTPSGSSLIKLDLHFDKSTGYLVKPEDLAMRMEREPGRLLAVRVRADLVSNKVLIPEQAIRDLTQMLELTAASEQRDMLQALIAIHGQKIGDLHSLRRFKADDTIPDLPAIVESKPPKRREDPTMPLFLGVAARPPAEMKLDPEGLRVLLENLARSVTQATIFMDRPPLLYFIAPPVLSGQLALDAQNRLTGSSLGRPTFSGNGQKLSSYEFPGGGTPIDVLLSESGALLSYSVSSALTDAQRALLRGLNALPSNFNAQKSILQNYPYTLEMLRGVAQGKLLLDFNLALATGLRPEGAYLQRLFLMKEGEGLVWRPHIPAMEKRVPRGSIAVLDAFLNPLPAIVQGKPPQLKYALKWGELPSEVRQALDWARVRVQLKSRRER